MSALRDLFLLLYNCAALKEGREASISEFPLY